LLENFIEDQSIAKCGIHIHDTNALVESYVTVLNEKRPLSQDFINNYLQIKVEPLFFPPDKDGGNMFLQTLVVFQQPTWRYIIEDRSIFHNHHCENFKSWNYVFVCY
jgi:hypothetical protein